MSNRSQLEAHRQALLDQDDALRLIEAAMPALARPTIARARAMTRAARQLLADAIQQLPAPPIVEDGMPALPDAWGDRIMLSAAARPKWLVDDDWISADGWTALASKADWSAIRAFRLRADHDHYAVAAIESAAS